MASPRCSSHTSNSPNSCPNHPNPRLGMYTKENLLNLIQTKYLRIYSNYLQSMIMLMIFSWEAKKLDSPSHHFFAWLESQHQTYLINIVLNKCQTFIPLRFQSIPVVHIMGKTIKCYWCEVSEYVANPRLKICFIVSYNLCTEKKSSDFKKIRLQTARFW